MTKFRGLFWFGYRQAEFGKEKSFAYRIAGSLEGCAEADHASSSLGRFTRICRSLVSSLRFDL